MSGENDLAFRLMEEYAVLTGLEWEAPPRRYPWTDAFAVCNYLGLHRRTGEGRFLDLTLALVDRVHHVLGRHREDDPAAGSRGPGRDPGSVRRAGGTDRGLLVEAGEPREPDLAGPSGDRHGASPQAVSSEARRANDRGRGRSGIDSEPINVT